MRMKYEEVKVKSRNRRDSFDQKFVLILCDNAQDVALRTELPIVG